MTVSPVIAAMVEETLPQARSEAWKVFQTAKHALDLDELTSIAYTGLWQAAVRWDSYCLAPDTPVLTADLRWVPVGSLYPGLELVGVDEHGSGGRGNSRKYRASEVLSAERRTTRCLRFRFGDGREVVCSEDHQWLARFRGHRNSAAWNWKPAWSLGPGAQVCSPLNCWQEDASFEAGWLAGIIDGEGNYTGCGGLEITQNQGAVLDRILTTLDKMGIPYRTHGKSCVRVRVEQAWARLELMGKVRTTRFDCRRMWDGKQLRNRDGVNYAVVERVEPAGLTEVVTLETSSGTYLANGLVVHNCAKKGFSAEDVQFFKVYATRRMRGAMLDAMRSNDWLTRSMRSHAKALRDAGQDLGRTEAELSELTGLSREQIRETMAGVSRKPVSVDAESVDIADTQGVESEYLVRSILGSVVKSMQALPLRTQVVLALVYFVGKESADIAELLGDTEAHVNSLHVEGVHAVHESMVRAAEG